MCASSFESFLLHSLPHFSLGCFLNVQFFVVALFCFVSVVLMVVLRFVCLFVCCCFLHTVSVWSWFHSLEVALLEMSHGSDISRILVSSPQPSLTFTASHTASVSLAGVPSLLQVAWPQRLSDTTKEESTTRPLLHLSCLSWMALAA